MNGIFSKVGRVVTVCFNGTPGNIIPTSIPEEYCPLQPVYIFVLVRSASTNRYFMGYVRFAESDIRGGAFENYSTTDATDLLSANHLIFGTASWIV